MSRSSALLGKIQNNERNIIRAQYINKNVKITLTDTDIAKIKSVLAFWALALSIDSLFGKRTIKFFCSCDERENCGRSYNCFVNF